MKILYSVICSHGILKDPTLNPFSYWKILRQLPFMVLTQGGFSESEGVRGE